MWTGCNNATVKECIHSKPKSLFLSWPLLKLEDHYVDAPAVFLSEWLQNKGNLGSDQPTFLVLLLDSFSVASPLTEQLIYITLCPRPLRKLSKDFVVEESDSGRLSSLSRLFEGTTASDLIVSGINDQHKDMCKNVWFSQR